MATTKSSWTFLFRRPFVSMVLDCARRLKAALEWPERSECVVTLSGTERVMGAPDDLSRHIQDNPNREYYHATVTVKGYHDDAPASKVVLKASLVHLELILQFQNLEPSFQASLTSIVENHFPKASSQFSQRPEEKRVRETRELQPGMEIDCYRLLQRLGSGMSGEVWKARVERTPPGVGLRPSESVAMKHYFESPLRGAELIRVHREFLVASKLRHPNLVRVFDLLLSPSRPFHSFLVMEHVEGRTLKAQIPNQGFDVKKVIDIGVQLFGAIEELHGQSALHRDIKAGNIMMLPTNELKLLDLGIVVATGESSLTATSVFIGSKHSAPIEQLSGEELDERTDIYAAGTVLFHSYTGRPIYHKVGPEGAIVKRMLTRPEKLEPKSEMDSRFVEFVNSCISVEAADRPNSARDCKEILLELLRPR